MAPKLIIVRHGRSAWNQKNFFTGWVDVPLDEQGIAEAIRSGETFRDIPIDVVFCSRLLRAQMTVAMALLHHASGKVPVFLHPEEKWSCMHGEESEKTSIPVHSAWELNERMYGALQGLNKAETAKKFGEPQVKLWRRSFDVAPPEGESLEMTANRTIPYFQKTIVPYLAEGKTVLISAHGNSLRSIVMAIDRLSKEEVVSLEIPTGCVIMYQYVEGSWVKEQ